jgi:hypothetical protein
MWLLHLTGIKFTVTEVLLEEIVLGRLEFERWPVRCAVQDSEPIRASKPST